MKVSEYLIILIFVCVFIGSLSLGIWQIDRGYDKKALENSFSQKQAMPVETNPGKLNDNLYYRNIQISGNFGKKTFFVDNKVRMAQVKQGDKASKANYLSSYFFEK